MPVTDHIPSIAEWQAALHEAAHSLYCIAAAGTTFREVVIHDNNLTGQLRGVAISDPLTATAIALAGPVVEAIFTGQDPAKVLRQPGAATDRQIALDTLRRGPKDHPGLSALINHVASVIRFNRVPIVRLADALQRRRRLSFDEAKTIVREASTMTTKQQDLVYDLARSMPHSWSDEYRLGLARNMLQTGRASPPRQLAFDRASGLRSRRAADAAQPKGGTSMPVFSAARSTRDQMSGMNVPPAPTGGSMDGDGDVADLVGQVHQCYGQMEPDQQDQLVQGLQALVDHHNGNNGNADDPDDAEDGELEVRGGEAGGYQVENQGNNDPDGTGGYDRRPRRRRFGAADRLSRSKATAGFAARYPDAMKISVR